MCCHKRDSFIEKEPELSGSLSYQQLRSVEPQTSITPVSSLTTGESLGREKHQSWQKSVWASGSQSVSLNQQCHQGNKLQMHVLKPTPDPVNSKLWGCGQPLECHLQEFWCPVNFENNRLRVSSNLLWGGTLEIFLKFPLLTGFFPW